MQLGRRVDQLLRLLVDEARVHLVGAEIAVRQQGAQEGDVAGRAFQPEGGERALGARQRVGEIGRRAVHDHLGQQRIEIGIGAIAGIAVGVDPHAGARRRLEHRERAAARLGRAVGGHGLHVDAELDGMAARRGAFEAGLGQARAAGQQQLRLHQIDAPHLFRHRVLDLQARVGLDEEEIRLLQQELEGAEAAILHGLGHGDGGVDDLLAQRRLEVRAGRQLDDLLAAPLQGAFALAQGHDAALAVAHDLHLDVARTADQPLGIEVAVAESRFGLGRGAREGVGDLAFRLDQPHAAPAATGDGLQRDARLRVLPEEGDGAREVDHPRCPAAPAPCTFRHERGRAPCRRTVSAARASARRTSAWPRRRPRRNRHSRTGSRSPDAPNRSRPSGPRRSRPRCRDRPPRPCP